MFFGGISFFVIDPKSLFIRMAYSFSFGLIIGLIIGGASF
jgi:hypothetical protein